MFKSLLSKIAARLKEPSTHAAITGLAAAAGLTIDAGMVQYGLMALTGLCGILAIALPEGK